MSEFTYTIKDGHDRLEDVAGAADASNHPSIEAANAFSSQLRQYQWDNRRITSHGTYFGGPEYQWLAHIPGKLAIMLDMKHPGWDSDERFLRKVLSLYPKARVLPEETQ